MTHAETCAYLQGFIKGIDGLPSVDQWDEIKTKINAASGGENKQQPIAAAKRKNR